MSEDAAASPSPSCDCDWHRSRSRPEPPSFYDRLKARLATPTGLHSARSDPAEPSTGAAQEPGAPRSAAPCDCTSAPPWDGPARPTRAAPPPPTAAGRDADDGSREQSSVAADTSTAAAAPVTHNWRRQRRCKALPDSYQAELWRDARLKGRRRTIIVLKYPRDRPRRPDKEVRSPPAWFQQWLSTHSCQDHRLTAWTASTMTNSFRSSESGELEQLYDEEHGTWTYHDPHYRDSDCDSTSEEELTAGLHSAAHRPPAPDPQRPPTNQPPPPERGDPEAASAAQRRVTYPSVPSPPPEAAPPPQERGDWQHPVVTSQVTSPVTSPVAPLSAPAASPGAPVPAPRKRPPTNQPPPPERGDPEAASAAQRRATYPTVPSPPPEAAPPPQERGDWQHPVVTSQVTSPVTSPVAPLSAPAASPGEPVPVLRARTRRGPPLTPEASPSLGVPPQWRTADDPVVSPAGPHLASTPLEILQLAWLNAETHRPVEGQQLSSALPAELSPPPATSLPSPLRKQEPPPPPEDAPTPQQRGCWQHPAAQLSTQPTTSPQPSRALHLPPPTAPPPPERGDRQQAAVRLLPADQAGTPPASAPAPSGQPAPCPALRPRTSAGPRRRRRHRPRRRRHARRRSEEERGNQAPPPPPVPPLRRPPLLPTPECGGSRGGGSGSNLERSNRVSVTSVGPTPPPRLLPLRFPHGTAPAGGLAGANHPPPRTPSPVGPAWPRVTVEHLCDHVRVCVFNPCPP